MEAPDFNFEKYRAKADSIWEKQLHKIEVTTSNENDKRIFYTMMYHMLAPHF
jgi:putative alpha-1,2-mannosidase